MFVHDDALFEQSLVQVFACYRLHLIGFLNKYLVNQIELRIIDADFITLHPSFYNRSCLR